MNWRRWLLRKILKHEIYWKNYSEEYRDKALTRMADTETEWNIWYKNEDTEREWNVLQQNGID